jgi:HEAT repeat protein
MPLIKKTLMPPQPDQDAERLRDSLRNGTAEQRWTAARGLARFADAVPALRAALAEETDETIREAIFTSLARLASEASFDAVLPYLRTDDATSRTAALDALKLMPEIVRAHLTELLHDPDPDIRVLACDLACSLPEPETAALLAAVVETDPVVNICGAAIDALAQIGTVAQLPALERIAARFSEPFLAFSARIAAERIRARAAADA